MAVVAEGVGGAYDNLCQAGVVLSPTGNGYKVKA